MAVRTVIKIGEKILREKSKIIKKFNTNDLNKIEKDLRDTLIAFNKKYHCGRGIAAVQIGILKKMLYIKTKEFEGVLINPKIVKKSKKMFWSWDSCFSADIAFFIKVKRYYKINVEYYNTQGEKQLLQAEDDLSELLQHEIDHLSGVLFIDYIDDNKKLLMMKEAFEKMQKYGNN